MKQILTVLLVLWPAFSQTSIRGIPAAALDRHRALEEKARATVRAEQVREHMRRMSAEPHHAGSPGSRAVAEYALEQFRSWGFAAEIEEFEALLPTPTRRVLELVEPERYGARLQEPVLEEDPDSGDAGQLPTYNAYSASGDVTAPLIYINYGIPEDYETLAKLGLDVKGKIVIARYGKSWRGTKVKVAREHGAVGCIIYSDPKDDGYFAGDVYPKGQYRPKFGAQRGSVLDMPLYPGDPLSPGWASVKGSRKLALSEAQSVMKIPVLPVSYEDVARLLEHLDGPVAPENWRGALPLTYHVGPGPAKVRLAVDFDWAVRPVYNVIARLAGSVYPDEWIIYGNHHDAWVNGAHDPASGAAALLETARVISELRRQGWQPPRTLVLALWDAEEFGLIGSTEWAEKHAEELRKKAVVYLNTDSNAKGGFSASGSHALQQFMEEVARDVTDPESSKSVLAAFLARKSQRAADGKPARFALGAPGAGSDYVAFIHFNGVPSLNVGFDGDGLEGAYHSIYDSFTWYSRFADSDFRYGAALAQVMATAILRLSEAALLPFDFRGFTGEVQRYLEEVLKLAKEKNVALDLAQVQREIRALEQSAGKLEAAYQSALSSSPAASRERLAAVNGKLYRSESALLSAGGLPHREWYRHRIYAPGRYTGYSAKTLPGVREALEAGNAEEAAREAKLLLDVLRALHAVVRDVTGDLQRLKSRR